MRGHRNDESKALLEARSARMREEGYISVAEAAALALTPESNVYHWIRGKEIRSRVWGGTQRPIYVLLEDLRTKVPAAFTESAAPVQKPVKRRPPAETVAAPKTKRLAIHHARVASGLDVAACGARGASKDVIFAPNIKAINCPECKAKRKEKSKRPFRSITPASKEPRR